LLYNNVDIPNTLEKWLKWWTSCYVHFTTTKNLKKSSNILLLHTADGSANAGALHDRPLMEWALLDSRTRINPDGQQMDSKNNWYSSHPHLRFCFPRFQLSKVNYSLKILSRKFQARHCGTCL
jgi:hypothetical protein